MKINRAQTWTEYRIVVSHAGAATLEQWHGDQLGYLPRALADAPTWERIGPVFRTELTAQRRRAGLGAGRWSSPIPLNHQEGREALLLFWGAERAGEALNAVIRNWRNLQPEERWYLVSQADATRGSPSYSPTRGWRQAIYHILVES